VFNLVTRPEGAMSRKQTTEDEEYERIARMSDSIKKLRPARPDSVMNGADGGGSGAVSLMEIAEAMVKGGPKPKRSVLFVWHTGSEMGTTWGSSWFTSHPTVPRDSIVALLNLDAVGRGEASDETGITKGETPTHGNPNYVELVGARRLSSELGHLIEAANLDSRVGMTFDYSADADGHPDRLYCRGDQWAYARYGIPAVLFTTGNHADTRMPTDEPQYIQYGHMARVDQLVLATAMKIANLDHRVVVDKPKPDPTATCSQ
jgi:Zn-dependent M28 family amino/carboxypeptidase